MSDLIKSNLAPETGDYKKFLRDIKNLIIDKRNNALKTVNTELIRLYWSLGEEIYKKQENSNWGDGVIKQLSQDLEKDFGKGFSRRNLNYIRKFYLTYKGDSKVQSLIAQISWTHHIKVLNKCNRADDRDHLRRLFYIKSSIAEKWSVRDLDLNLDMQLFEKWALKQTNFEKTLPQELHSDASAVVKDSYNFNLLDLEEPYLESKLEDLMVKSIENTLKNFGSNFCFIGRQYEVTISKQSFYIDLLFFHRELKCLVAVELKTTDFKAEHSGKMNLYLSALEDKEMKSDENPPIGIILVKQKDRTIVEYALKGVNAPMGVAT